LLEAHGWPHGRAIVLAVVLVSSVTWSPAAEAAPIIGIGEQKADMFTSRHWQRLGIRHARYIAPWDALQDPYQRRLLDAWMAGARRARVKVLLGFAHSLRSPRAARRLPTAGRFGRQFRRFRRRYPDVRNWLVWNEANHPGSLTQRRPRRAAAYFDVVARNCRGCRIVAADLLDVRTMTPWLRAFVRHAHARPRIWGLHNYGDVNGNKTFGVRTLLAETRGAIWFTETGGLIVRRQYRGRRVVATYRYSLRHAARATGRALRMGCLSPRIRRIYLYHWRAPSPVTSWDSGLLGPRGKPRPAYRVLLRRAGGGASAADRHRGVRLRCGPAAASNVPDDPL
jgi:hypothetical protein